MATHNIVNTVKTWAKLKMVRSWRLKLSSKKTIEYSWIFSHFTDDEHHQWWQRKEKYYIDILLCFGVWSKKFSIKMKSNVKWSNARDGDVHKIQMIFSHRFRIGWGSGRDRKQQSKSQNKQHNSCACAPRGCEFLFTKHLLIS